MTAPILLLAPMQGITDSIFREALTQLGGIDTCVSVYARVSHLPLPAHSLLRICPEMATGGRTRHGTAVVLQLLGSDPSLMAETARRAVDAGAMGIDLNFGCPVSRVNRHDGGAALLEEPRRITRVIRAVRDAVPASIALSAQVRAGWSRTDEAPAIAQAVEQGGAGWLTMHGRTRKQLYEGKADWEAIGKARRAVTIPVVANGDIRSVEDMTRCAEQTGCERFMIGRGALAKPELFRWLKGLSEVPWQPRHRLAWLVSYGDACVAKGLGERTVAGRAKAILRHMSEVNDCIYDIFIRQRQHDSWLELRQGILQDTSA